jgi:hypothetical protein
LFLLIFLVGLSRRYTVPMKHFAILAAMAVLSGCSVTLHGNQATGGGATAVTTGSSVQAGRQFGNARVGGSFGTPPPASAAGGQVRFSSGASAVLVAGLVIAEAVDVIGGWFRPAAPRAKRLPAGNISQTCSCYAATDEVTALPAQ